MRNHYNIEGSNFGKPYYVGYATFDGNSCVYHIFNVQGLSNRGKWKAIPADVGKFAPTLFGNSLAEISNKLSEVK